MIPRSPTKTRTSQASTAPAHGRGRPAGGGAHRQPHGQHGGGEKCGKAGQGEQTHRIPRRAGEDADEGRRPEPGRDCAPQGNGKAEEGPDENLGPVDRMGEQEAEGAPFSTAGEGLGPEREGHERHEDLDEGNERRCRAAEPSEPRLPGAGDSEEGEAAGDDGETGGVRPHPPVPPGVGELLGGHRPSETELETHRHTSKSRTAIPEAARASSARAFSWAETSTRTPRLLGQALNPPARSTETTSVGETSSMRR